MAQGKPCSLDKDGIFYVCGGSAFVLSGLPEGASYALFPWNSQSRFDLPYATGQGDDEIRPLSPATHLEIKDENGKLITALDVYMLGLSVTATPVPGGGNQEHEEQQPTLPPPPPQPTTEPGT